MPYCAALARSTSSAQSMPGRRQAVRDVDDAGHLGDCCRHCARLVVQPGRVDRRKLAPGSACRSADRRRAPAPRHRRPECRPSRTRRSSRICVGRLALAPVDEFVLDDADDIFRNVVAAATRLADARIDRLDARPAEDALSSASRVADVHLGQRQVAARMHVEQAIVRLDRREELDARAVLRIGERNSRPAARRSGEHRDRDNARPA